MNSHLKQDRSKNGLVQALVILPLLSGLWLAIGVAIVGALTPNYSHVSQFMSALGAADAPFAIWVNYAVFIPAEGFLLGFLFLLKRRLPDSRTKRIAMVMLVAYAVLLIFAALLPCDVGCHTAGSGGYPTNTLSHKLHMAIAAVAYPLALIGLLFMAVTLQPSSALRRFALPSAIIGFCLYVAIPSVADAQGLFQRLTEAWIYLQLTALGYSAVSYERESV